MNVRELVPFVGWGVAGVPVVGTFLQAVFALAGVQGRSVPVVGGIVEAIISMPVFREAAVQFKSSTTLVLGLFALIALAWVGQGIAMGAWRNRDATFAFAGLVSVLFLVLFFGVYAPLFSADVGGVGLVLFVATPFVASVGALGGAWTRDWDADLEVETATALSNAEDSLASKRAALDDAVSRKLDEASMETLAEHAPNAVADARSAIEEEREGYADVEAELESIRTGSADASVRRERAIELRERVESRDPAAAAARIESRLAEAVLDVVERGDVDITVRSRYGKEYDLVNLPTTFREFELSPDGRSTHVGDVDHALRSMLDGEGDDLATVVSALERVEVHRERIQRHVEEAEASFHESLSSAETDVERTREELQRLEGAVRNRVTELAVDGQDESVESVHAVERKLRDARSALHACRFDAADEQVTVARETAAGLLTSVQFFGSVAGALGHGQERLSLPPEVSRSMASALKPAFEREYPVEYVVRDDAIVLRSRDGVDATATTESNRASTTPDPEPQEPSPTKHVDMESVVDEVLLLLDEFRDAVDAGDRTVHVNTDSLPSFVATAESIAALEQFANRQSDLVESVDVPSTLPGIVDVRFAEETTGDAALESLQERFKREYT
ncbi:hypothetical protein [Halorubellus sp. PRR65]|uniref:hypothetical protein n=1 Tax=Halorubellus sp. PRR65 TaxID=3098148 RepID=UPI002B25DB2A|nr:hypothetical protein [Halorubellus sp. PRR65]